MIQTLGSWTISLALVAGAAGKLVSGETPNAAHPEVQVGDFRIRPIQDARIQLPVSDLSGIDPKEASRRVGGGDFAWTPVNAFLVRTPKQVVLVDAGIGKHPEEDSGHLQEGLRQAGTDPAAIDLILITHFHFDHIGGLTSPEGARIFPKALVRVPQAEHEFWMRDQSSIPEALRERAGKIKAIFAPYIAAKAYFPFLPDENLGSGIRAMASSGHTPGHTGYSFASKGKELWCIGDLIHFGSIQFDLPRVGIRYDSDPRQAVDARLACFRQAAASRILLAATHLPALVQLKRKGDGFTVR